MSEFEKGSDPGAGAGATRSVDRALRVLIAVLEPAAQDTTLSGIARATDLSPSTASRLLATLSTHGLVSRDADGRYRTGVRMKQIAAESLRDDPLYEASGPHLAQLAAETGETASLGIAAEPGAVLYLRQAASDRQVQTKVWTGRTIPREGTALGAALDGLAEPGAAHVSRRADSDVVAVASAVYGPHGEVIGAISVNSPQFRTTDDEIVSFRAAVSKRAVLLSRAMGAPPALFTVAGTA